MTGRKDNQTVEILIWGGWYCDDHPRNSHRPKKAGVTLLHDLIHQKKMSQTTCVLRKKRSLGREDEVVEVVFAADAGTA